MASGHALQRLEPRGRTRRLPRFGRGQAEAGAMITKLALVDALRAAQQRIRDLEAELALAKDKCEELEDDLGVAKDEVESLSVWFEGEIERLHSVVAETFKRREVVAVIRPLQIAGEIPWWDLV
jgi:hypothetical protein